MGELRADLQHGWNHRLRRAVVEAMGRGILMIGQRSRMGIINARHGLGIAVLLLSVIPAKSARTQSRIVEPVLAFPERGLDDPASYQGYQTRFFRDAMGNVVQIYLDTKSGRVVNLLADAVNESVGFTVRDAGGRPIRLDFASQTANISTEPHWTLEQPGRHRTIEYVLVANAA